MRGRAAALLAVIALAGCGDGGSGGGTTGADRLASRDSRFPSIVRVRVARGDAPRTYDFTVTVSSPYDSRRRFANGWRIVGDDYEVYGRRRIARPHPDEQPFTLRQRGVRIPDAVVAVHVEGRDSRNGYGGQRYVVELPGRSVPSG